MFWSPVSKAWPFFFAGKPASAFEGSTGVVAGTGSLIDGMERGRRPATGFWELLVPSHFLVQFLLNRCLLLFFWASLCPAVWCWSLGFTLVSRTLLTMRTSLVLVPRMSSTMRRSSSLVLLVLQLAILRLVRLECSEVNLNDAQLLPVSGLLEKGTSRGQREVADVVTVWPTSSAVSSAVGRRVVCVPPPVAGGNRAERQCNEAGSLFVSQDFASIRVENPSSRVARVTSTLHNLCLVHSPSIPAHDSHAPMSHARCVVYSVGDTEDGGTSLLCTWGNKVDEYEYSDWGWAFCCV